MSIDSTPRTEPEDDFWDRFDREPARDLIAGIPQRPDLSPELADALDERFEKLETKLAAQLEATTARFEANLKSQMNQMAVRIEAAISSHADSTPDDHWAGLETPVPLSELLCNNTLLTPLPLLHQQKLRNNIAEVAGNLGAGLAGTFTETVQLQLLEDFLIEGLTSLSGRKPDSNSEGEFTMFTEQQ